MIATATTLRQHALRIWQAAVEAVRSDHLVHQALRLDGHRLMVEDEPVDLSSVRRIAVVGAGKAGAGMAAAAKEILARTGKEFSGWINVPADCVRPLDRHSLTRGAAGRRQRADGRRRRRQRANPAAGRIAHRGRSVPVPALRRRHRR